MKSHIEPWSIFFLVRVRSATVLAACELPAEKRKTNKSKNETKEEEKRIPRLEKE